MSTYLDNNVTTGYHGCGRHTYLLLQILGQDQSAWGGGEDKRGNLWLRSRRGEDDENDPTFWLRSRRADGFWLRARKDAKEEPSFWLRARRSGEAGEGEGEQGGFWLRARKDLEEPAFWLRLI